MEAIARKAKSVANVYTATLVIGIVLCVVSGGLFLGAFFQLGLSAVILPFFIMLGAGGAVCAMSGVFLSQIRSMPDIVISREGEMLYFPDFACPISELTNVSYRQANGRGYTYAWGTLSVYLGGREEKFKFIADVVAVHNRLLALMLEQRSMMRNASTQPPCAEPVSSALPQSKFERNDNGENNG